MNEYGLEKVYVKDQLGKEILYDLFVEQRKTDREIGELYNTSPFTVRALREEHGINSSLRKSYKELIPKELFIELYIEEGLLLAQIAEVFNINTINVARLKRDYKIDEEYKGIQGRKYRAKGVKKEDLFRIKKSLRQRGDLI